MPLASDSRGVDRVTLRILFVLCFASGIAGLAYQVAWTKWLSLSFGSSIVAASAVVAGFLGGTGIGAALYHRVEARAGAGLRLYAGIEIGIALSTLALSLVFDALPRVMAVAGRVLPPGVAMDAFRVSAVFALLLIPASLMGATYPALCRAVIRSRAGVERDLGWIYGLNTLGAALGALLAGLIAVEWLGLQGTVLAANALNLAVAATAFALARRLGSRPAPAPISNEVLPTKLPFAVTGFVLVVSGYATISYEILWFRALRYLVGNSTYAISVALVVFLMGLGLGALLYPRLARRNPERNLAYVQLATAGFALLAIALEEWILRTPALNQSLSIFGLELAARDWWQRLAIGAGTSLALLLPATLCMGLSFPLASRLYLGSVERLGRRVGSAYLLANLGSIAAAIITALVTLPWLGSLGGVKATAALNVALALFLLSRLRASRDLGVGLALASALAIAAVLLPQRLSFRGVGMAFLEGELVFEQEGELATVQVRRDPDQPARKAMLIDGTIIGVSEGWYAPLYGKQLVLAHLPMVLMPDAKRTLNVGLGSGSTLAALAGYDTVEGLDVVEINSAVLSAAELFEEASVFADPRVHIEIEDVLHALLRGSQPYDLIISDGKQNEDFAGNAKILSSEFYAYARERLSPDGMLVQWIPLGTPAADFRIIVRTIASAFPQLEVFFYPPESVIMVGSNTDLRERPRMTARAYDGGRIAEDLRVMQLSDRDSLLAGWVAGREALLEVVGDGPRNSWDRLPLEYAAYREPRGHKKRSDAKNLRLLLAAHAAVGPPPLIDPAGPAARSSQLLRRALQSYKEDDLAQAMELVRRALAARPGDPMALAMAAELRRTQRARRIQPRR